MILVTGATGNIGSEIVRQLVAKGHRIRVLTRDPAKVSGLGDSVEAVRGDLTRPETIEPALRGVDEAFLLAGAMELPEIAGHFASAAKRAGVRHIVLNSSSTILMQPPTTIGRWHLAAEEAIKASGLAWTMLRPGNFASNTLRWVGSIRAQGAIYAPGPNAGDSKSAPIDPRDIASVAVKALTSTGHDGKTYVLTGPVLMSVAEQVQAIAAAIGKPLKVIDVPEAAARAGMIKSGMSEVLTDAIMELMRPLAGSEHVSADVREVTGVDARPFAEWARDHAAAFA